MGRVSFFFNNDLTLHIISLKMGRNFELKCLFPEQAYDSDSIKCRSGGIGRHRGLKIPRPLKLYRFKSGLRQKKLAKGEFFFFSEQGLDGCECRPTREDECTIA